MLLTVRTLVLACAAWLTLWSSVPLAHAQPSPAEVEARQAFENGRDAYDRGRFEEALALFERAFALSGRTALLFNIGRAADSDGQVAKAVRAYDGYLAAVPGAENREFVEARLAKLRPQVAGAPPAPAPVAPVSAPQQPAAPLASAPPPQAPPQAPPPYAAPPPYVAQTPAYVAPERPPLYGFRFNAGFRLGMGGKSTRTISNDDYYYDTKLKVKLKVSPGFQLGAGYVWRFFGIGGELRYTWLKEQYGGLDVRLIDFIVKPRFGYVAKSSPFEIYVAFPLGLVYPKTTAHTDAKITGIIGGTIGFVAGFSLLFTDHFGANAEFGGYWYSYSMRSKYEGDSYDLDGNHGQYQLVLNALFKI